MSILKDRIRPLDPSSLQEFLGPEHEAARQGGSPEPLAIPPSTPLGKTSFQLASRGGHVRDVTGTVADLDEDAQTYMVLGRDGELLRVALRDITSAHEAAAIEQLRPERDVEGLGTT
jgi:hypothetical protein